MGREVGVASTLVVSPRDPSHKSNKGKISTPLTLNPIIEQDSVYHLQAYS